MQENIEIQSFTIQDMGDTSVGIPATQFELSGGFVFEDKIALADFKKELLCLLDRHGFIDGRADVETDVEYKSRVDAYKVESENLKKNFRL
jgi:hypothetical protein